MKSLRRPMRATRRITNDHLYLLVAISFISSVISFKLGWNARGRYQARRALDSIRRKHDAAKPLFRHN